MVSSSVKPDRLFKNTRIIQGFLILLPFPFKLTGSLEVLFLGICQVTCMRKVLHYFTVYGPQIQV